MKLSFFALIVALLTVVAISNNVRPKPAFARAALSPVVSSPTDVQAIAVGDDLFTSTCAIRYSAAWCSPPLSIVDGLGGSLLGNPVPGAPVPLLAGDVTEIDVGYEFACAIDAGAAFCWGSNSSGQVGNGGELWESFPTPQPVVGMSSGVTAISAGVNHACAIKDGGAWCWGINEGQLGTGSEGQPVRTPVPVAGFSSGVTAVSAGGDVTCAVKDGPAWCWGAFAIGVSGVTRSDVPVVVQGMENGVTAVSAGWDHACAIQDGSLWCWGNNRYGQLGNNSTSDSDVPVAVSGLSGATKVTAALGHTCALQAGSAWCWGRNGGRLGNNSTSDSPVPVLVSNLTGVSSISAGAEKTCAIATSRPWCWGWMYSPTPKPLLFDLDRDACIDDAELGSDHALGGDRDPFTPDFFDVPVPSLPPPLDPPEGTYNGAVTIGHVIAILPWIGTSDGGPPNSTGREYNSDTNENGVSDGAEYDHAPSTTPGKPWRSGAPNGAVSIQDAITALIQVGDHCPT